MWFQNSKIDNLNSKESLFLSLYEECRFADPGARLSYHLRNRLEKLPKNVRREIASLSKDGCTPLFIACKRGHVEIVEYLITVCDVDIEQRGMFELPDARNEHCVTPLWCAAVSGKLPVTMCLVKHGADVNAVSDTGNYLWDSCVFCAFFQSVVVLLKSQRFGFLFITKFIFPPSMYFYLLNLLKELITNSWFVTCFLVPEQGQLPII